MAKYSFSKWENNETNPTRTLTVGTADLTVTATYAMVTHKLTFRSQPAGIQASVNGQPVADGATVELPEGSIVTIIVPGEVSV